MKLRFGLRSKLLLLSGFLFTIPWFGYQYVWEMEKHLRFGQEQTMFGTARALAQAPIYIFSTNNPYALSIHLLRLKTK